MPIVEGYYEITDPREAVLFVGQDVEIAVNVGEWEYPGLAMVYDYVRWPIRVTPTQLWKVIRPRVSVFAYYLHSDCAEDEIEYVPDWPAVVTSGWGYIAANAITIGKTIGQLRELVAFCKGVLDADS